MTCASGGGVTRAWAGVQVRLRNAAPRLAHAVIPILTGVLAACASPVVDTPVGWWHDLQGGRIAEERPAAPGADDPYRNLSTVPAKPAGEDPGQRARVASLLAADHAAADLAPLPVVARPAAPVVAPPPPSASAMGGSLAATSKPEPAAVAPAPPPAPQPVAPASADRIPATMPSIPDRPPAPPVLPGVTQVTVPRPIATKPVAQPPVVVAQPVGNTVMVAFPDGSATVPDGVAAQLRGLAGKRAGRTISVAGHGGASVGDQVEQARQLDLAWTRAAAIAGVLRGAGVPDDRLLISAFASGRGGTARIAD